MGEPFFDLCNQYRPREAGGDSQRSVCTNPQYPGAAVITSEESQQALRLCIRQLQGQTAVAEALTVYVGQAVTRQTVNGWLNQGKRMPSEMALALEALTDHQTTAAQLRPDLAEFFNKLAAYRAAGVTNARYQVGLLANNEKETNA